MEVPFGESFAISSNMTGLPQPDLLCHFNGQPLPTCPAGMATSLTCVEGGVVMIAAMETSNEGLYSCTANNSQGEASYQIRVGLLEELSEFQREEMEKTVHDEIILAYIQDDNKSSS